MKVGVEISHTTDTTGPKEVNTVLVNGYVSAGVNCEISCATEVALQVSFALEVEIPIPNDKKDACAGSKLAYVMAYMLEEYAQRAKVASPNAGWWESATTSLAEKVADFGYYEKVQELLLIKGACDSHKVTSSAKIKLRVGTPDMSAVQLIYADSIERTAKFDGKCNISPDAQRTKSVALAIKPVDEVKMIVRYKMVDGPTDEYDRIKTKITFRVKSKKEWKQDELKPDKRGQLLIGGAIAPVEKQIMGFVSSWGQDMPPTDPDMPPAVNPVQALFQGVSFLSSKAMETAKKKLPFLGDFVTGLNERITDMQQAFTEKAQKFTVETVNKARFGVDYTCTWQLKPKGRLTAKKVERVATEWDPKQKPCVITLVTSTQQEACADISFDGMNEFTFKGVMGQEFTYEFPGDLGGTPPTDDESAELYALLPSKSSKLAEASVNLPDTVGLKTTTKAGVTTKLPKKLLKAGSSHM